MSEQRARETEIHGHRARDTERQAHEGQAEGETEREREIKPRSIVGKNVSNYFLWQTRYCHLRWPSAAPGGAALATFRLDEYKKLGLEIPA